MSSCKRVFNTLLVGVFLLGGASPAAATAFFWAPETVQADGTGQFTFTAILTAGADCVGFAGYHFEGVVNVDDFLWVDTFCIDPQPVAPGTNFLVEVTCSLVDPISSGSIMSGAEFCTGGGGSATTQILAPTVAVEPTNWSSLKACYR